MSLRPIFDREKFYLSGAKNKQSQCFVFLLISQQDNEVPIHARLNSCWNEISKLNHDKAIYEKLQWLSFGKPVSDYSWLHVSYQAALSTLKYQQNVNKLQKPFYSNLTIFRLVEQINDKKELHDIIHDYIGPLLAYDSEKGTELLRTLQVYLKNLGSKNETARELFIVRQTLYHRLDRIKQLIGDDYMEPGKRVMIEFSLYTLEYMERDSGDGNAGLLEGW
jgi:purine catabolism regulator